MLYPIHPIAISILVNAIKSKVELSVSERCTVNIPQSISEISLIVTNILLGIKLFTFKIGIIDRIRPSNNSNKSSIIKCRATPEIEF